MTSARAASVVAAVAWGGLLCAGARGHEAACAAAAADEADPPREGACERTPAPASEAVPAPEASAAPESDAARGGRGGRRGKRRPPPGGGAAAAAAAGGGPPPPAGAREEGAVGSWQMICAAAEEGRALGMLTWGLTPGQWGDLRWQRDNLRWGNTLSTYWQARGLAALAGIGFEGARAPAGSPWRHLPAQVPPNASLQNHTALREVCASCRSQYFSHECSGGWRFIRPTIQEESHAAFERFAEASRSPLPEREEVLVHLRLEFEHRQVAWPGRSSFVRRIPRNTSRIRILHQPYRANHRGWGVDAEFQVTRVLKKGVQRSDLDAVVDAYREMLGSICNCPVVAESSDAFWDFATMLRVRSALFCSGSSFCMWAAMGNRHAHVYMPGRQNWGGEEHAYVDSTFHWDVDERLENRNVANFKKMPRREFLEWVRSH